MNWSQQIGNAIILIGGCIIWGLAMPDVWSAFVIGATWGVAVSDFFNRNIMKVSKPWHVS